MWPGDQVSLNSDPALLDIARNTFEDLKPWRTGNLYPEVFPAAVRVGYPNVWQIMSQVTRETMLPNLLVYQEGGGVETCGASLAVNDMLLQGHEGFLRLFPGWPKEKDARFGRLRAPGAFLVSSAMKRGVVSYLVIESEKGKRCSVMNPWPGKDVAVTELGKTGGTRVSVEKTGDRVTFQTRPGEVYSIDVAR